MATTLFLSYRIALVVIAALMALSIWRRRSSVEIPWALLAFVLLLAAFSDLLVGLIGSASWSVELVVNRIIATTWLGLCALIGASFSQGGVEAAVLGESDSVGPRQVASAPAIIRATGISACCGAILVLFSVVVFSAADALGYHEAIRTSTGLLHLAFVATAGVRDEIVFRLGMQTFLHDRWRSASAGTASAIIASSILFSMAHAGNFELVFLKFAQIFPVSCVLGIVFLRWGLVGSSIAHVAMNVGLAWVYA